MFSLSFHKSCVLQMAAIQLLQMMIPAPSNYTFPVRGERERDGRKSVILKSPLDVGLIIVCLVSGMAVIETLAVGVYIQRFILIISPDHKLVCTSSPISWFDLSVVCLRMSPTF